MDYAIDELNGFCRAVIVAKHLVQAGKWSAHLGYPNLIQEIEDTSARVRVLPNAGVSKENEEILFWRVAFQPAYRNITIQMEPDVTSGQQVVALHCSVTKPVYLLELPLVRRAGVRTSVQFVNCQWLLGICRCPVIVVSKTLKEKSKVFKYANWPSKWLTNESLVWVWDLMK